jgi:hypothetical protein
MARTNRQALLQALAAYRRELDDLEALVAGERWSELEGRLGAAQALRPAYLGADPPTGGQGPAVDDSPAAAT